jgi:uncharacterized protein YpiB (UPF0302 family)
VQETDGFIYFQWLCQLYGFRFRKPIRLWVLNYTLSLTAQVGKGAFLEGSADAVETVMLNQSSSYGLALTRQWNVR